MEKKMFHFVDTHCHVHEGEFGADVSAVLDRAAKQSVRRMLVVGGDFPTSKMAVVIAERYASLGVFAAVGVHPHEASTVPCCAVEGKGIPDELRKLTASPRVLAIGETGLDYHYDHSPRDLQRAIFREHIRWSHADQLPLVIHGRESYSDLLHILKEEEGDKIRGVIHCFSGTERDAAAFLEMGYFLSFAGPLTFRKNESVRELFRTIPDDRILLETDSPYLAPPPYRGKKNEPAFVRFVYETAAEVKGISLEKMAWLVENNAERLFEWNDGNERSTAGGK